MKFPWSKSQPPKTQLDPDDQTLLVNILVRMGVLEPWQVARALGCRTQGLIGRTLVAMQFATQEQVDEALWRQSVLRGQVKGRALVTGHLERVTKLQRRATEDLRELADLATRAAAPKAKAR